MVSDLWNAPLPKDNSVAMNIFIVLLKIIATFFLCFAWIFILFIASGFDISETEESNDTPDPFSDAAKGIDETMRGALGNKENIL